jgi:hypothetical protein
MQDVQLNAILKVNTGNITITLDMYRKKNETLLKLSVTSPTKLVSTPCLFAISRVFQISTQYLASAAPS